MLANFLVASRSTFGVAKKLAIPFLSDLTIASIVSRVSYASLSKTSRMVALCRFLATTASSLCLSFTVVWLIDFSPNIFQFHTGHYNFLKGLPWIFVLRKRIVFYLLWTFFDCWVALLYNMKEKKSNENLQNFFKPHSKFVNFGYIDEIV